MPPPGVANVTVMAVLVVRAVDEDGLTVIVAALPGPVAVLQLTVTGDVAVSTLACIAPAPTVKASKPAMARGVRFLRIDVSKGGPSFFGKSSTVLSEEATPNGI
jgi:hypothetical protein